MTLDAQSLNLNARQILIKRLSTVQALGYTGPIGELVLDTTLKLLRIQDGSTAGGILITSADYLGNQVANLQSQINSILSNVDPAALDSLTEIVANVNALLANNTESSLVNSGFYANLTATGNLVVDSAILPKNHLTQDLGSPTRSWRSIYLSNATAYFGNSALTITSNGLTVTTNGNLVPMVGNIRFPDGTVQTSAVDQGTVANIYSLLTANVAANLVAINNDVTNAISYFGNIVSTATAPIESNIANLQITQDRLISGNANIVLTGGNNPFVTFPAVASGENIYIQGSEIAGLVGNLAITSANHTVINTGALGSLHTWLFRDDGITNFPTGITFAPMGEIYQTGGTAAFGSTDYNVIITANLNGASKSWDFGTDGDLHLPGNLLPTTNDTYDIGDSTNRFRDIWLSNSTIYLGNATISSDNLDLSLSGNVSLASNIGFTDGSYFTPNKLFTKNTSLDIGFEFMGSPMISGETISLNLNGMRVSGNTVVLSGENNEYFTFETGDTDQRLTFSNSYGFIKFGATTRDGTGAINDIELWSYGGDDSDGNVHISAGSSPTNRRWTFNSFGNIIFPDSTVQPTAFTGSVDRLTSGSTNVILTGGATPFVTFPTSAGENIVIQGGEIAVANGNAAITSANSTVINVGALSSLKTFRFDESGKFTVPGDIIGYQHIIGGLPSGERVTLQPSGSVNKPFLFSTDQSGGTWSRSQMEFPGAEVNKAVTLGFPHSNGSVGYIYNQGTDTSSTAFNNAFNIMGNSTDVKIGVVSGGGNKVWTFAANGSMIFSDGTIQTSAYTGQTSVTWQQVDLTVSSPVGALYLTAASTEYIYVTTSNESRNIRLPDATTLTVGRRFVVRNSGNAGLPIQNSAGTAFNISIYQNQTVIATVANVSVNSTSSWMLDVTGSALTGSGAHVMAFAPTITGPTLSGISKIGGVQEFFSTLLNATGTVNHDCSNTSTFRHVTPAADWTANFTNMYLQGSYNTTLSIVIEQGSTAYYPNAVQIQGVGQTINWQGGGAPTPTPNRIDVVNFTVFNNSGTYTVLGRLTGF